MAEAKKISVEIRGQDIAFTLQRSKRKTVTLCVNEDGTVLVKAPNRISQRDIKEIVAKRGEWILEKQEQMQELAQKFPKFQGKNGEKISYLGSFLTVRLVARERAINFFSEDFIGNDEHFNKKVWREGDILYVSAIFGSTQDIVRRMVEQWYRDEAKRYFAVKITYYERVMGIHSNRLFVKDQKSRWGSCSSKGNINLNWRLISAPEEIIEYVIVHELCHLIQMDHSAAFWHEVEKVLPDYRERRQWLKEHGRELKW